MSIQSRRSLRNGAGNLNRLNASSPALAETLTDGLQLEHGVTIARQAHCPLRVYRPS